MNPGAERVLGLASLYYAWPVGDFTLEYIKYIGTRTFDFCVC